MRAFAIINRESLKVVYIGLHESHDDTWRIYLGWPDATEIQDAKMRFVCAEIHLYPAAQQCRL